MPKTTNKGRIPGAIKKGNLWLVPCDAVKPEDLRRKGKQHGTKNT